MKNNKINFISRTIGVCLSGVINQAIPKPEIRVLTPIEQDKLIATVKDNLETWQSRFAIIFALFTGIRE